MLGCLAAEALSGARTLGPHGPGRVDEGLEAAGPSGAWARDLSRSVGTGLPCVRGRDRFEPRRLPEQEACRLASAVARSVTTQALEMNRVGHAPYPTTPQRVAALVRRLGDRERLATV